MAAADFHALSMDLRTALIRCRQVGWPVDVQRAFYAWQAALMEEDYRRQWNRAIMAPLRGISPEEDRHLDALEAETGADARETD